LRPHIAPDAPPPGAGTLVSGTISANTTWSLAGSPYVITPCVQIANGATLTIAPGVVVKVVPGASGMSCGPDTNANLIVDGALVADGTATQPIVFTSNNDTSAAAGGDTTAAGATNPGLPAPGDWGDIVFAPDAAPHASSLTYARVLYGQSVVDNNTSPTLHDDTLISTTLGLQFYAAPGTSLSGEAVTNTIIQAAGVNSANGIVFNAPVQGVTLSGNTLVMSANDGGIILTKGGSGAAIAGNDVQAGFQGGIDAVGPLTTSTIVSNTVAPSAVYSRTYGAANVNGLGIALNGVAGVTVISNTVAGNGIGTANYSNGVRVSGPCAGPGVTVAGNTLTALGSGGYNGIAFNGCRGMIRDNLVDGTAGYDNGIHVYGASGSVTVAANSLSAGSTADDAARSGIVVDGTYVPSCFCYLDPQGLRVVSNTVTLRRGSTSGIIVNGRTNGMSVDGNTVELGGDDSGSSGIVFGDVAVADRVTGNTVRDGAAAASGDGITFGEVDSSFISGNAVTAVQGAQSGLVFSGNARGDSVYNNRLVGDSAGGILFNPFGQSYSTVKLDGSVVSYNVVAGGAAGIAVLFSATPGAPLLDHNTLVANSSATPGVTLPDAGALAGGVLLDGASPVITDSLIISNAAGIDDASTAGAAPALGFNDVFGNAGADYLNVAEAPAPNGDQSADPLFANPALNDFSLHAGSPALGAAADGSDLGALQTHGQAARLVFGAVTPNPVTPAAPTNNVADVGYTLSGPLAVTVVISAPNGSLYRTLATTAMQAAGSYDVAWDGTDGNGNLAPDGVYTASIQGAAPSGGIVSQLDLPVGVANPALAVAAPSDHPITNGSTLTVTPSPQLGPALTGVVLCATRGATGSCDTTLARANGSATTSPLTLTVAAPYLFLSGPYDLFLQYTYAGAAQGGTLDLGRYSVVVPPVLSLAAPYPFPNPLLTAPHNSRAYYSDAPAAASWAYQASQPLTVSLAISGADGTPITTVVQSAFGAGSIAWNGTGATGAPVPNGVYALTIAAQDASGAPAPVRYNGAPTTTTVTETVLDDAASLTSPLSGSVVSGSASFGVSLSPLLPLSSGSSACVALSSVANASTLSQNGVSYTGRSGGTGEGNLRPTIPAPPQNSCVVPSGGAFTGTVDTTRVANGNYDVIASFSLTDANSGATDYYNSYVIGWVTVRNAPAFLSTPAVAANPFTPNGDGANDTFNVAFTAI